MNRLNLDNNEWQALTSALDHYLDGEGIEPGDEDQPVLDAIFARLGRGPR